MTLTVTVTGQTQEELAETLEHEVLRLVWEGYKTAFNSNDTGSYTFDIEGWDDGDDGQPDDLKEHSDFAQDDMYEPYDD